MKISKIHTKHYACRLCGSTKLKCVIPMEPIPIGEHYSKEPIGKDSKRYPIDIYQCMKCSGVQTNDNIDSNFLWKDYTYFSGQTSKIIDHFNDFAEYINNKYKFEYKTILDIGSNDGSLLKEFKKLSYDVEGIDPADTVVKVAIDNGIKTALGLFNEDNCKKYFKDRKL